MRTPKTLHLSFALTVSLSMACISGDNSGIPHFHKPTDLLITSADVTFDGAARRLAYVSNYATGTVSLFDVRNRRIFDTDEFDDEETPLTVGGRPIHVFEWKPSTLSGDTKFRLVVVDQDNARLVVIDLNNKANASGERKISHAHVDMGGNQVTVAGTPQFFDQGRSSNPSISDVTLDTGKASPENWKIRNVSDEEWVVEGSKSGEQSARAISGTPYESDNGAIAFTILEGERRADPEDAFFFGVVKIKPLNLSITPVSARLIGNTLFVADRDSGVVQKIDLLTGALLGSVTVTDGSGTPILGPMTSDNSNLYVSNRAAGESIFVVDQDTLAFQTFTVGMRTQSLFLMKNELLLMPLNSLNVGIFNTVSQTLLTDTIAMANVAALGLALKGDEGVDGDAFIINQNNAIDLVDVAKRKRIDTQDLSDPESFAGSVLFYDQGADSNPALVDIITKDGSTNTENWLLSYEGVIANNVSADGALNGNQLTDATADFVANQVQVGDTVVLQPNDPGLKQERIVAAIVDAQTLTLVSAPTLQGSGISYEIRATKSYTMVGSTSGFQNARAQEGKSSQSDGKEITFSVSPASTSSPTNRGDYFSFETNDGITPIPSDGDLPVDSVLFEQQAYILNQNSNDITVVSVPNLQVSGGVD